MTTHMLSKDWIANDNTNDTLNMQVIIEENKKRIKAWIDGVELEDAARAQLLNVAGMPFVEPHLAVMPDVHWGCGATDAT